MNKNISQVNSKDAWYQKAWRPTAALVFLFVVIFDFVIMPVMVESFYEDKRVDSILEVANKVKDKDIKKLLISNIAVKKERWVPLTTTGGGLFFLSFGTILGAAAWTRGKEKIEREKRCNRDNYDDYDYYQDYIPKQPYIYPYRRQYVARNVRSQLNKHEYLKARRNRFAPRI